MAEARARVLEGAAALATREDAWRELAVAAGNPFLTPEWTRAAAAQHARSRMLAVVAEDGGELQGVLPLLATRRRAGFPAAALGDRFGLLARRGHEERVARAAGAALAGAAVPPLWVLDRVDAGASWPAALARAASPARALVRQRPAREPYIGLPASWEEYLQGRSAKLRKRLRYLGRRLEREHAVAVRDGTGGRDIATFFALHDLRWRARGGSSLPPGARREFLERFCLAAAERGWLRLRLLEADGGAVAALLGWRLGERFCFYQAGFDPAWSRHSVGTLLVAWSIRDAIAEGAREFDFLLGDEQYKGRFADRTREVESVVLVPARSPRRLAVTAEALARRHGAGLARSPRLARLARRLLPTSGD